MKERVRPYYNDQRFVIDIHGIFWIYQIIIFHNRIWWKLFFFQSFCSIILFSCQKQNVKFLYIYGMIEGYSSLECAFYLFTYAPGPWTLLHMYVCMYVFILFFTLSVFALNVYATLLNVRWNVCMIRIKLRIRTRTTRTSIIPNLLLKILCFFFILSYSLYVTCLCVISLKMFYQLHTIAI